MGVSTTLGALAVMVVLMLMPVVMLMVMFLCVFMVMRWRCGRRAGSSCFLLRLNRDDEAAPAQDAVAGALVAHEDGRIQSGRTDCGHHVGHQLRMKVEQRGGEHVAGNAADGIEMKVLHAGP